MKYVFLIDNMAREIIPEINPNFPDLPITARYTPEFLSQCVAVDDNEDVQICDIYDPETGKFSKPYAPGPIGPDEPVDPDGNETND